MKRSHERTSMNVNVIPGDTWVEGGESQNERAIKWLREEALGLEPVRIDGEVC